MKIVGIGGTNGSGKDTVANMLVERHGYLFASATDMFVKELNALGLPIDRKHKSALSAKWRRKYGMAVVVDKAIKLFEESGGKSTGVVVGSLRHPSECDRIHELGGIIAWVDADASIRYERIQTNLRERKKTHAEAKSFEQFLADEAREMSPEGDEATLNMFGVKERADIKIMNDDDNIKDFKNKAEKALGLA